MKVLLVIDDWDGETPIEIPMEAISHLAIHETFTEIHTRNGVVRARGQVRLPKEDDDETDSH